MKCQLPCLPKRKKEWNQDTSKQTALWALASSGFASFTAYIPSPPQHSPLPRVTPTTPQQTDDTCCRWHGKATVLAGPPPAAEGSGTADVTPRAGRPSCCTPVPTGRTWIHRWGWGSRSLRSVPQGNPTGDAFASLGWTFPSYLGGASVSLDGPEPWPSVSLSDPDCFTNLLVLLETCHPLSFPGWPLSQQD